MGSATLVIVASCIVGQCQIVRRGVIAYGGMAEHLFGQLVHLVVDERGSAVLSVEVHPVFTGGVFESAFLCALQVDVLPRRQGRLPRLVLDGVGR